MSHYISSVSVTLSPRAVQKVDLMKTFVVSLDYNSGATMPHAVHFVNKSPLIKPYLSNYDIVCLVFKYSEL